MANFVPTASGVVKGSGARENRGIAGEAIEAGELVYVDTTDSNKIKLADADTSAAANVAGVAMNDAATGQWVVYQYDGHITVASGAVAGRVYTVSTTAGAWATAGDALSGDFVSVVGIGVSGTSIKLSLGVSDASVA